MGVQRNDQYYALKDTEKAAAFLLHPLLESLLVEICKSLYGIQNNNASEIFGCLDNIKLKSSLTSFAVLPDARPVFNQLLKKFFAGKKDETTLAIIGHS